jgi:hypothetical protein
MAASSMVAERGPTDAFLHESFTTRQAPYWGTLLVGNQNFEGVQS